MNAPRMRWKMTVSTGRAASALTAVLALSCMSMTAMACIEPARIDINDQATYFAVPDVVGEQEASAVLCLQRYESVPRRGGDELSASRKGTVLRTDPVAGTGRGGRYTIPVTVTYWVASGENSIPDVGGQPLTSAHRLIRTAGFRLGNVQQSPEPGPPDLIIGQDPQGGTVATLGSVVAVTVSSEYPRVPDVIGVEEAIALEQIASSGLSSVRQGQLDSPQRGGIVLLTTPVAGTQVTPDSTVSYVVASGQNEVPDVRGHRLEAAGPLLEAAGFVAGGENERVDLGEPGLILEQIPAPGTLALLGTAVSVWISTELRVPDVVGMPQEDAAAQLGALGLTAAMAGEDPSPEPQGRVTSTDPIAGTKVTDKSTVHYRITSGFNRVPDLLGRTPAGAEPLLIAAGFQLGDIGTRPDAGPKGIIIGQDPAGGGDSSASIGQKVNVTVSSKSVVPNVVDRPRDEAERLLHAAGFSARQFGSDPSPRPNGTVLRTQPRAGAEADPGATVAYWAASGENHVPSLIGHSQPRAQARADGAGFKLGIVSYRHDPEASGQVLQQQPRDDALARLGAAIDVTLGSNTPPVPDVVGKSEAQAEEELRQLGMTLLPPRPRYGFTGGGRVLDQVPAAGSVLASGEQVQVRVTIAKSILPAVASTSALALLLASAWWTQLRPWPWHWPPAVGMRVRLETETDSPPPSGLIRGRAPDVRLKTRLEPGDSTLDGPLPIIGTETRDD